MMNDESVVGRLDICYMQMKGMQRVGGRREEEEKEEELLKYVRTEG